MNLKRAPVFALGFLAMLLLACLCTPTPPTPQPAPTETDLGISGEPLWPAGVLEVGLAPYGGDFVGFGNTFDFDHGPQGGIHVPIAWRVHDREFTDARFVVRVRRAADGLLVNQSEDHASGSFDAGSRTDAGSPDAGSFTTTGDLRAFLCPVKGIDLTGVPLTFELTVIGADKTFLGRVTAASSTQEPDCKP